MNFRLWLQETGDLNAYGIDDQESGKVSKYRPLKEPRKKTKLGKKVEKLFKGEAKDLQDRGAGCVFTDGECILLLLRSADSKNPRTWGIPAGHAREGETPMRTAFRETKEEIGVDPRSLSLKQLGQSSERNGRWVVFVFQVNKQFSCKLNNEHTDSKWVPIDDLLSYPLHPLFKRNMRLYLSMMGK